MGYTKGMWSSTFGFETHRLPVVNNLRHNLNDIPAREIVIRAISLSVREADAKDVGRGAHQLNLNKLERMSKKNLPGIKDGDRIEIQLGAISPVSYLLAKDGDLAQIKAVTPRIGEYRDKIGAAEEAYLVFKGDTKIGMIPRKVVAKIGKDSITRKCRIVRMIKEDNVIVIRLFRKTLS